MKNFKLTMKALSLIYIGGGLSFFFFTDIWATLLKLDTAPDKFWVTLTAAMMAMLAFLAWQSSKRPKEKAFVQCHLLAKATSTSGFIISYIGHAPLPAYLVGAVTDFSIIVLIWFLYKDIYAAGKRA